MSEGFQFSSIGEKLKGAWNDFQKDLVGFGLMSFVGMIVSSVTFGFLSAPITVGYMKSAKKQRSGEKVEIGDAFSGLSNFGNAFVFILLMSIALGVITGFLMILQALIVLAGDIEVLFIILEIIWFLLTVVVSVAVVAITGIITPIGFVLIAEEGVSFVDAFKKSFKWIKSDIKKALEFLVTILVGSLTSLVPVVGAIVAVSFTSFITVAYYAEEKEAGKF